MVDVASLVVQVKSDGVKQTEKDLKNLGEQAGKTANQTEQVGQKAKVVQGNFKAMKGSTQQVSYQLQDIAVQAQMGTNAFVILGQQGPQLASIFGSGGAVVGALIAFGALAGGVLVTALTGTTDAMKELEEEANKLSEDITRLTAAEQAYQRILIKEKIDDQKDALASLQEELKGASRAFVLLSGESQGESLKEYIETEEEFTKRTFEMRSEIQLAKQNIESLGKSIDGTSNITEDLIVNLEKEVQVLGLTARQAAILEAVNSGADPKDVNRLHLLYNKIEAHKKEQKALKDKAAEDKAASDKLENFNAKLDEQAQLMTLVGDALYLYQAQQAGATGADAKALAEKIKLNAELKESARLKKEEAAEAKRADDKAKSDAKIEAKRIESLRVQGADRIRQIEINGLDEKSAILEQAKDQLDELDQLKVKELQGEQAYRDARNNIIQQAQAEIKELNDKEIEEEARKAAEKEKIRNQLNSNILGQASSFANESLAIIEQGFGKESAAYKAMFAAQQGLAIAQAIMATETSAAAALAPPPLGLGPVAGLPYSNVIRGLGYASVGIIAGQTVAGLTGRALGGQVRGGESYLVGERGPELLTMGGSGRISSNDQLKAAMSSTNSSNETQVNVNFAIQANDTAGFDRLLQSRRGQIISMINQAVNDRGRVSIA
jgi:hypothetical protein